MASETKRTEAEDDALSDMLEKGLRELRQASGADVFEWFSHLLALAVQTAEEAGLTEVQLQEYSALARSQIYGGGPLPPMKAEGGAVQIDLGHDAARLDLQERAARLGPALKKLMAPGEGFLLLVATYEGAKHQAVAHVSTIESEAALALVNEWADYQVMSGRAQVEPSVRTAAMLRAIVGKLTPEEVVDVKPHDPKLAGKPADKLAGHLRDAAHHLFLFKLGVAGMVERSRNERVEAGQAEPSVG